MLNQFERAPWHEFYYFLAKGDPPLIVQVLAINTAFFAVWIIRRFKGSHTMRRETVLTVQSLLIAANAAILFREDFMRVTNLTYYWHKLAAGLPAF